MVFARMPLATTETNTMSSRREVFYLRHTTRTLHVEREGCILHLLVSSKLDFPLRQRSL